MATAQQPDRKAPPRVALLNDTSAWYHWGCSCTSFGMRSEIGGRGFDVDAISIFETYKCQGTPAKIADYNDEEFFKRFCAANTPLMKRLAAADVVVVNGEGTLHGTGVPARNLLYLAYVAKARLGRALHIINHSCFPEDSAALGDGPAKALYKLVYGVADFIAVREPLSAEIVTALDVPFVQAFDCLPFYVAPKRGAWRGSDRQGVVLAGCVAWRENLIPMLAKQIEDLRLQGHRVSVLMGAAANPAADDKKFVAALQEISPNGWELVEARSEDAWLRAIGSAKLLISGRFHHTIAAACLGTPSIAFGSNTPKIEGMLDMLGLTPPLDQSAEDLEAQLQGRIAQILQADPVDDSDDGEAVWKKMFGLARRNFEGLDSLIGREAEPA